jgi:hypothetical protein
MPLNKSAVISRNSLLSNFFEQNNWLFTQISSDRNPTVFQILKKRETYVTQSKQQYIESVRSNSAYPTIAGLLAQSRFSVIC